MKYVEEAQNNQRKHKMDSDDDVKLVDSQSSHAEERPALKKRGRKSRWEKLLEDVNNAKKSNPAEVEVAEVEEHKAANVFDYPTIFWKLARPKYGVFTFMCNDCRNENFKRGDKRFLLNTGSGQEKLEFTQTFCQDCAKLNFDCTDLIMKHQKKDDGPSAQKNGGRNTFFKTENNTPGFVGNKTNKFKVHLPKKLVFDGPGWMVGMSGIIYPNSWATVGTLERQYVVVHLRDGRKFRFRVPRGSFLSPQQLERGMHHGMIAEMERLLTRKRSIQYPDEGEILDMEVVEEEETGEAPVNPLKNRTKLDQLSMKYERDKKEREEEDKRRQQREEQQRKQQEEQQRKQQEDQQKKQREEQQKKQREEQQKKQREEQQRKQREEQQRKQKEEQQRKQREKEQEKAKKSEAERLANEKKTEKEQLAKKAEEERLAKKKAEDERLAREKKEKEDERLAKKAEDERLAREKKEKEDERLAKKAEDERLAREKKEKEDERLAKKAEDERLAREKKEKEDERLAKKAEEDRLARLKQRELELLKELKPWRGGYMRLVHGKDPTPDVHYLHEKDDYHFVNAVHKYIVRHPEQPWDSPEFNPSAIIQQNIAEFREIFESEVFDENYALKTREEKNELIELVKGFRFYFADELGRFTLRIFSDKISHITLTDQLAYVLGYEQQQEIHNEDQAKFAVDLAGGVSHLCIYLNSGIIESMIFGNTFANLLQVIAVEGTSGSVVEKDFQSPLFHKIVAREVDVLDVEIRTLTGR
ncbi:hypothetical protein niasHS_005142 [Heterodera schachtii]|uniref:Uncharacterized protein n=1 Tax=Heterodera schachtii TaxID=97005 RepID=A0ABD2JRN3_HETSC